MRWNVNSITGLDHHLSAVIDDIKSRARTKSDAITVLVLASVDTDGLCSACIFGRVLTSENIVYSLLPVNKWSEVRDCFRLVAIGRGGNEEGHHHRDIRTVVLLGCGAVHDLEAELTNCEVPLPSDNNKQLSIEDVILYCFDSQRPVSLSNCYELHSRVVVIDEDADEKGDSHIPAEWAADRAQADGRGDSSDDEEDLEADNIAPKRERIRQRRLYHEYYEGYYHTWPAALMLLRLADERQVRGRDITWAACVSAAAHADIGQLSRAAYENVCKKIYHDFDFCFHKSQDPFLENETCGGGLLYAEDLRIIMYRHLTLIEALTITPYIYGFAELGSDAGRQGLQQFLAEAGIQKSAYEQRYASMPLVVKRSLLQKLKQYGPRHGYTDLTTREFLRRELLARTEEGYLEHLNLSAIAGGDMARVVDAVLNSQQENTERLNHSQNYIVERSHDAFNTALTMLRNYSPLLLGKGMQTALLHQRWAMEQARLIDEQTRWRLIRTSTDDELRLTVLHDPVRKEIGEPSLLRRCALCVVAISQQRWHRHRSAPYLICCQSSPRLNHLNTFVCVGVLPSCISSSSTSQVSDLKNCFATIFDSASTHSGAVIEWCKFDSKVVEVRAEHFDKWISAISGDVAEGMNVEESDENDSNNEEGM